MECVVAQWKSSPTQRSKPKRFLSFDPSRGETFSVKFPSAMGGDTLVVVVGISSCPFTESGAHALSCNVSLQRIILSTRDTRGAVSCRRMGTSSFCKGRLLHTRSTQQPRKRIVSLVAARLVINSVRLLALLDELLRDRPWLRPHGRILDGDHVFKGVRPDPRPALNQMEVLARALKIRLRCEVRYVDNEGVAFPVPTRIAVPLADVGGQMGTPIHYDVPLPPLSLTHVVEHRDATWRLHDPVGALTSDPREAGGQAADRR